MDIGALEKKAMAATGSFKGDAPLLCPSAAIYHVCVCVAAPAGPAEVEDLLKCAQAAVAPQTSASAATVRLLFCATRPHSRPHYTSY